MKRSWVEWAWDAWCITSVIGIWPRYIEPRLLGVTRLEVPIPHLPPNLAGLKILHFSDLHWNAQFLPSLQKKLIHQTHAFQPDLIVFTGDFLCRSQLENEKGLRLLLNSLRARLGCFAVLGNHDYARFVTISEQGEYDVEAPSSHSPVGKGFKRLFRPVTLMKRVTEQARQVGWHESLVRLLHQTPFQVLRNETRQIAHRGSEINICGLEEYTLGKCDPDAAFSNYQTHYPGIVLSHNPDTLPLLAHYPGDLILSGHTHGGQVNLPGLWKCFTRLEHPEFKRGLKALGNKWAYINRGISGVMAFRWFSVPELTLITLQPGSI